jgi:hypothetical protein
MPEERTLRVLWLDDVREPWKHGYINAEWVKTAAAAIEALKTGKYDFASLDHDLAEEHYPWNCSDITATTGTGYDVVCWLEQNPEFWPKHGVRVHSANPVGKARMWVPIDRHYGIRF